MYCDFHTGGNICKFLSFKHLLSLHLSVEITLIIQFFLCAINFVGVKIYLSVPLFIYDHSTLHITFCFFSSELFPQPVVAKHIKDKEHKKKKLKPSSTTTVTTVMTSVVTPVAEHENVVASHLSLVVAGATVPVPGAVAEETEITKAGSEGSAVSSHIGVALGTAGVVPATTPGPDNEALQMGSLTCMKKLKKSEDIPAGEY
jgi:hypothetical protein